MFHTTLGRQEMSQANPPPQTGRETTDTKIKVRDRRRSVGSWSVAVDPLTKGPEVPLLENVLNIKNILQSTS